jgi:U4/U6.U5 tri-snRNP component SNU23
MEDSPISFVLLDLDAFPRCVGGSSLPLITRNTEHQRLNTARPKWSDVYSLLTVMSSLHDTIVISIWDSRISHQRTGMPSSPPKKPAAASHIERRTWDTATYEQKAKDRRKQEESIAINAASASAAKGGGFDAKPEFRKAEEGAAGPQGSERAFLQARTEKLRDLDERVGSKVEVILEDAVGASKDGVVKKVGVGWHCSVCNCMLKDSNAYLDHINGRRHLRLLGFSMRVERSTETDLMEKLEKLKKKKLQSEQGKEKEEIVNFDELVKEKDEAEKKRIAERRRKRKERRERDNQSKEDDIVKREQTVDEEDIDVDEGADSMAAIMGFSGFGGSSNKAK